jgi:hypothetical protein
MSGSGKFYKKSQENVILGEKKLMGGRGPYAPALDRVADCVCEVYPVGKPLSFHEAAQTCGQYQRYVIDSRTLGRYVRMNQAELNLRTSRKCGKKVQEKCVKAGFEVVQSLEGTLRDRRKQFTSRSLPEETINGDDRNACLAEPESKVNTRFRLSLPSPGACKITRSNLDEVGSLLTGMSESEMVRMQPI